MPSSLAMRFKRLLQGPISQATVSSSLKIEIFEKSQIVGSPLAAASMAPEPIWTVIPSCGLWITVCPCEHSRSASSLMLATFSAVKLDQSLSRYFNSKALISIEPLSFFHNSSGYSKHSKSKSSPCQSPFSSISNLALAMSNPSKDVPLINPMTVQDLSRVSVIVSLCFIGVKR